jgi:hypothetical protein
LYGRNSQTLGPPSRCCQVAQCVSATRVSAPCQTFLNALLLEVDGFPPIDESYELRRPLFADNGVLVPLTGAPRRPETVYVHKRPAIRTDVREGRDER